MLYNTILYHHVQYAFGAAVLYIHLPIQLNRVELFACLIFAYSA